MTAETKCEYANMQNLLNMKNVLNVFQGKKKKEQKMCYLDLIFRAQSCLEEKVHRHLSRSRHFLWFSLLHWGRVCSGAGGAASAAALPRRPRKTASGPRNGGQQRSPVAEEDCKQPCPSCGDVALQFSSSAV